MHCGCSFYKQFRLSKQVYNFSDDSLIGCVTQTGLQAPEVLLGAFIRKIHRAQERKAKKKRKTRLFNSTGKKQKRGRTISPLSLFTTQKT